MPRKTWSVIILAVCCLCLSATSPNAQKSGGKTPQALIEEGRNFEQRKQYDRAIAAYSQVITMNPRIPQVYILRGMAYGRKQRPELTRAISDFNQAIRLDAQNAFAYAGRGIAYNRQGRVDQAIADLSKAIQLDPRLGPAYEARAMAYLRKRDYRKALQDVEKAKGLGSRFSPKFLDNLKKSSQKTR